MGMKPQTDAEKASAVQRLAYYLSGEEAQKARFESYNWGPSNNAVAATDAVKSDPTLSALAAQNAYAKPQGQIHGSWWDIAKLIATNAKEQPSTPEGRQAVLTAYRESIEALFTMSDAVKNAFTVIGGIEGSGWGSDFEMDKVAEDGTVQTWKTTRALKFNAGDEFKIRQGLSWDNALGATNPGELSGNDGNYAVTEAGEFFVQFVYDSSNNTGEISLVK